MIINNTHSQNNQNFGISAKKTAELVQKWTDKKRPDKLVLMLTRDDYPPKYKRMWADYKAFWGNEETSQVNFFRVFAKKYKIMDIGDWRVKTVTDVTRNDLFNKALNAVKTLMSPNSGANPIRQEDAKKLYEKYSTPIDRWVRRDIPELNTLFFSNKTK